MTPQQFFDTYLGKKIDWDGAYAGQCVDEFRQYHHDVLGKPQPRGVDGAADFWANYETDPNLNTFYEKIPYTKGLIVKVGDVCLWNKNEGGGKGHIDTVAKDITQDGFTGFDQNWPTLSKCTYTPHTFKNVLGIFRIKGGSVPDTNCQEQLKQKDEEIKKANGETQSARNDRGRTYKGTRHLPQSAPDDADFSNNEVLADLNAFWQVIDPGNTNMSMKEATDKIKQLLNGNQTEKPDMSKWEVNGLVVNSDGTFAYNYKLKGT